MHFPADVVAGETLVLAIVLGLNTLVRRSGGVAKPIRAARMACGVSSRRHVR